MSAPTMSGKVVDPSTLAPVQTGGDATYGTGKPGVDGSTTNVLRFDPHFTDNVIKATGPNATPRLRKVMASLTRHLHDFCRGEIHHKLHSGTMG